MKQSIVEVAICTLGRPSLLKTVRSLERQVRLPDRLIVVHQSDEPDGLEDEIRAIYPGSVLYIHRKERGLSKARNTVLSNANGDWLMWCDDDEEVSADWVCQLEALTKAHPHVSFFGGPMLPPMHLERGMRVDELYAIGDRILDAESFLTNPWGPPGLALDCWGGNMAYRQSAHRAVGKFDENLGAGTKPYPFGEETDYHMRAISKGLVGMLTPRLVIYHESGARPENSADEINKLRSCAAIAWKSRQNPVLILPILAARVTPFGAKKALLSRLTGGVAFPEHGKAQEQFDKWLSDLDSQYVLVDGCLVAKGEVG